MYELLSVKGKDILQLMFYFDVIKNSIACFNFTSIISFKIYSEFFTDLNAQRKETTKEA